MATRAVVITPATPDDQASHVAVWTGLLNGDDGAPVKMPHSTARCMQALGTFGAGGAVQLEGSNEAVPVNWALLNTPQGTTSSRTAASMAQIQETPLWVRPKVSAGDGTTSLTVNLHMKKVAP